MVRRRFTNDGLSVQLLNLMGIPTENLIRATVHFEAQMVARVNAEYYVMTNCDERGGIEIPTEFKEFELHAIEASGK